MKYSFNNTIEIAFKSIPQDLVTEYLNKLKDVNCRGCKVSAITVDWEILNDFEQSILVENDQYTPQFYYYWTRLIFEINKICSVNDYNAFWFDSSNKKYYDETIGTCIDLMTHGIKWGNNNAHLYYAWGEINQRRIFKDTLNCEGILLPCMEGWGIIAVLKDDDFNQLKHFFE